MEKELPNAKLLTQEEHLREHSIGNDTHDRTELLRGLRNIDKIPKRSIALLTWIIVGLSISVVAFAVGWATAEWNIILIK